MPREVLSRIFTSSVCRTCRTKLLQPPIRRAFSSTPRFSEDEQPPPPSSSSSLSSLSNLLGNTPSTPRGRRATDRTSGLTKDLFANMIPPKPSGQLFTPSIRQEIPPEPHHLHIYSTKHNTHLTLTRPNREPIISFSSGNIGFRKAQRGSYDAAFQLAAYVFKMMKDRGLLRHANERDMDFEDLGMKTEGAIRNMEVILRGYGKGERLL